jgi:hypothetical protein
MPMKVRICDRFVFGIRLAIGMTCLAGAIAFTLKVDG